MSADQFTSLINSIEKNQYSEVLSLSTNRKLMSMKTSNGATPLIHACRFKNTSLYIIQCLFSAGSQLLTKDNRNTSPFLAACESGNFDAVKFLYSKCKNKDLLFIVDSGKEDPLTKSVKSGNCEILQWLLERVEKEDDRKRALYYSVIYGNVHAFNILKTIKFQDIDYNDLFNQCTTNPNLEIIKALHSNCTCLSAADYIRLSNRVKDNEKVKDELLKYSHMRKRNWHRSV